MARLGKRERLAKRATFKAWRGYVADVVAINLKSELPKSEVYIAYGASGKAFNIGGGSRDETSRLKGNTHTRGISIGQRKLSVQKPGSY